MGTVKSSVILNPSGRKLQSTLFTAIIPMQIHDEDYIHCISTERDGIETILDGKRLEACIAALVRQ
ncbi:hypothetical protein D2E25_1312 [Bifidobacterium goeldii]|uniref:Uncharacterized protein n=1 Tax=Bifidobacterium goeldii TaxID=2306975 RepID=A0A430FIZ1_9BIFI|nr:hypothetical protein D2E25_1312 [Bifidobacterium goeldii]